MGFKKDDYNGRRVFAKILSSDGTFRVSAAEGDEGAERRDYELPNGNKGSLYEYVFKSYTGMVTRVVKEEKAFDSGKVMMLNVEFKDTEGGDENLILNLPLNSNFASDILKKLPSAEAGKEITLKPYAFTTKEGKRLKGVNIFQDGEKLPNFFYDAETKTILHGFPEADSGPQDADYWKYYFSRTAKWLYEFFNHNIAKDYNVLDTPEDTTQVSEQHAYSYDEYAEQEGPTEPPIQNEETGDSDLPF